MGFVSYPLNDMVFQQCPPVLLWINPLSWWCSIFMLYVHHLLVLGGQSIVVLALFPEIRDSLNYLFCHRALIHINQESSHGAWLFAKIYNFYSGSKRNYCVPGCCVLQFLVWFISKKVLSLFAGTSTDVILCCMVRDSWQSMR